MKRKTEISKMKKNTDMQSFKNTQKRPKTFKIIRDQKLLPEIVIMIDQSTQSYIFSYNPKIQKQ